MDDLVPLTELFEAYRIFYHKPPDFSGAMGFLQERIGREESVIFVADAGTDGLVGFVQLYPLFSSTRLQRLWLLNDLYVQPEQRGRGISVQLIDRCKQLCTDTNACGLLLETAKDNVIGNQLYPRTGFVPDTGHQYYYWNA